MNIYLFTLAVVGLFFLLIGVWKWLHWNAEVERRLDQNEHDIHSIREWLDEVIPTDSERENTKVNIASVLERVRKLEGP